MRTVNDMDARAPMSAAPFVWRADGRPDWRVMWESFCDLALHGGPPHRGPEQALRAPDAFAEAPDPDVIAEIRRGIWETTGLIAEMRAPGWIAVTCASPAMAKWLADAIVLENVAARAEEDRLLLPAGPGYRLENEVKSIVTVVAKTHHYWDAHLTIDAGEPVTAARSTTGVPRPLRVGIEGPAGAGKSALIDAIRRRLAGRLTVSAPAAGVMADDPDLVLLERATTVGTSSFSPDMVDAIVGVLDAAAAARDGDRVVGWRLLVISKIDTAVARGIDVGALESELRRARGDTPVLLANLAAPDGADAVIAWLERELLLGA
jgi:Ni2+-binding GTPase involved in maturation of urease and hydrogenase